MDLSISSISLVELKHSLLKIDQKWTNFSLPIYHLFYIFLSMLYYKVFVYIGISIDIPYSQYNLCEI
jgi:hypothetical protein